MFTTYQFNFFDLGFLANVGFWGAYGLIGLISGFALVLYSLFAGGPRGRHHRAAFLGQMAAWKVFAIFGAAVLVWWYVWYLGFGQIRENRRLDRLRRLRRPHPNHQ